VSKFGVTIIDAAAPRGSLIVMPSDLRQRPGETWQDALARNASEGRVVIVKNIGESP
jgi:hypothetical protein